MSKPKKAEPKIVAVLPSQIVWTDERLAALDKQQLGNLLENLHAQRMAGRVSDAIAEDVSARIRSRLPKRSATRRKSPTA